MRGCGCRDSTMTIRTKVRARAALAILFAVTMTSPGRASAPPPTAASPYVASIERWRTEHEAGLKAEDGWLTVVGLAWLQEGVNTVGSGDSAAVRLDSRSAPAQVGAFELRAGVATFVPGPAPGVRINGQPATRCVLGTGPPSPDQVTIGTTTMFIIKRGARTGVRVRDSSSEARRTFAGLRWYPVQERYRIVAKFVPYTPPITIPIANVLGDLDQYPSPGYVVFTIGGREYRLHPVVEGPAPDRLFFVFRDLTTGMDTYGGGRFLYTDMPKDGQVVVDFNKAESPPCAFTAFATCPLPPKENALPVRVEAGEKNPHP